MPTTFLACSRERNDGIISVLRLYLSCQSRSLLTWGSNATKNYTLNTTCNSYWHGTTSVGHISTIRLHSAIHTGKYRKEDKLENRHTTKTKHNPEKANNTKHSRTELAWYSRLIWHSARKQGGLIIVVTKTLDVETEAAGFKTEAETQGSSLRGQGQGSSLWDRGTRQLVCIFSRPY